MIDENIPTDKDISQKARKIMKGIERLAQEMCASTINEECPTGYYNAFHVIEGMAEVGQELLRLLEGVQLSVPQTDEEDSP